MIDAERLQSFAEQHTLSETGGTETSQLADMDRSQRINESPETLRVYLEEHNVAVTRVATKPDGKAILILDGCPMNPEHGRRGETAIVLQVDGKVGFKCWHDSCSSHGWQDVRTKIDPDRTTRAKAADKSGGPPSQATTLVELASDANLFHNPGGDAFATVPVGNHHETLRVSSRAFRRWLSRQFYKQKNRAPGGSAVQDALGVLEGKAVFEGEERHVYVRVASASGAIYLDLVQEDWQAVEITSDSWRVVASHAVPVRFIRRRGMLSLPTPVGGGAISSLRSLVNLRDDNAWILFIAWLVAAFRPSGPYPVLAVNGEHGSAKSTLCRIARSVIDPNIAPLRRPPRQDRDLMIAATNSWLVAFDNLSGIAPSLSDSLCALATGGGFATRELYSDDEEKLFDAMRPVMVNGIDDVATRPDLLDRAITLTLPTIAEPQRRAEADLWAEFKQIHAEVLGALLDAVSTAIRNLPRIELDHLPRMADFAAWVAAAEPALGWEAGQFMEAYGGNRESANSLAIESSPVGPAVVGLMYARGTRGWSGIARELLAELEDHHSDEKTRNRRDWPKGPRAMGAALRGIAPNLRASGVSVAFYEPSGRSKRRIIHLEQVGVQQPASSAPSANRDSDPENANSVRTVADRCADDAGLLGDERLANDPHENGDSGQESRVADHAYHADGRFRTHFKGPSGGNGPVADPKRTEERPFARSAPAASAPVSPGGNGRPVTVPAGWSPASWAEELRRKASSCEELNPGQAVKWREQAAELESAGAG